MYLIQPTIGNFKRVKEYFYHHNPKRSWSKEKDKLIDIKKKKTQNKCFPKPVQICRCSRFKL